MEAATHPGRSQFYARALFFFEDGDRRTSEGSADYQSAMAQAKLAWGITADRALLLDAKCRTTDSRNSREDDAGVENMMVRLKARFFRSDLSPLNTIRASVAVGAEIPGELHDSDGRHVLPAAAVVATAILNRHGLNAEASWLGRMDAADDYSANASYLYRLRPARYSAATRGAWYAMIESLNRFDGQSHSANDLAPGLLYEARRWAAELGVRLPVRDTFPDEYRFTMGVGVRYLF